MKHPLTPIDLREHVRLGIEHIRNSVDRRRDCRPYFRFNLTTPPVWSQHEDCDTPHTVGRFLHALNVCTGIAGPLDDAELLHGLRKHMFASCAHEHGFAQDDVGTDSHPPLTVMHHQREALLGLIAVWRLLQDPQAERYARTLVAAMEKATRVTGTYPGATLGSRGWQDTNFATMTSGRAVGALLVYSRTFDDPLAVELALRFARHVLASCFGENGELTPAAGTHIHSITGTVASLAELGLVTGQREFTERARLVFDSGLLPYRTRTGWVKEGATAHRGRGEANCTADLIEAACLLGMAGSPSYFEDADRMLRNHLLASQMDDLSWVVENEGMANTDTRAYEGLRQRARGAFCFAEPNGFHSYNSDLTGAALQGIAAAWQHIITREGEGRVRINMLLSRQHEDIRLTSLLPQEGRVILELNHPTTVSMRLPPWTERQTVNITIDGHAVTPMMEGDGLTIDALREGTRIEVTFAQPEFVTQERALGYETPYRVRWLGNAVMAMSGTNPCMTLYPALV
ncbi:MAG: hypothetical protein HY710_02635 [Candidatus Latescibacteria bacterium]|nr:hypothetical protein [Candidatus Latescibacterota bacterium]